jgi:hypothetical protein
MKAFGNHFRVEDETFSGMQTYNSGFASVFDVPIINTHDVSVNNVGVLKDILKLNYRSMHISVIFFCCEQRSNTMHHKAYVV